MTIVGYSINDYWWLLMAIILMVIGGYSISGYWWLLMDVILMVIILMNILLVDIGDY